jgi:hypothetical protein
LRCSLKCVFSVAWHVNPKVQNPTYFPFSLTSSGKWLITRTGILYLKKNVQLISLLAAFLSSET